MSLSEFLVNGLRASSGLLNQHLADLSDADLLVRPVPGANHAAWQLSHLLYLNAATLGAVAPDANVPLPAKLADATAKGADALDDAAAFPTKAELLGGLSATTDALIAEAGKMSDADFDRPGPEAFRAFAPTIGALLQMTPMHTAMHLGQFQVLRRKLGKPRVF